MNTEMSIAHKFDMNSLGNDMFPNGLVPWRDAMPPDPLNNLDRRSIGSLRSCHYCGSMHPSDIAAAIKAGYHGEWADWKYGWPHKSYWLIPNPFEGQIECTTRQGFPPKLDAPGNWQKVGEAWFRLSPAPKITQGKFYTVHLQDATPEERQLIEQELGIHFEFLADGRLKWATLPKQPPTDIEKQDA